MRRIRHTRAPPRLAAAADTTLQCAPLPCQSLSSTDEANLLALFISLSVALPFLALVVGLLLYLFQRKKARSTARLRATSEPPVLNLVAAVQWHMFLSHCWATGQDQVHTIHAECTTLLPEISMFLVRGSDAPVLDAPPPASLRLLLDGT